MDVQDIAAPPPFFSWKMIEDLSVFGWVSRSTTIGWRMLLFGFIAGAKAST
jgi:hypothetical protein